MALVLLFTGAGAIGQDMARRGVGGYHGWRYAVPFFFAPWFMTVVWVIERHRFPILEPQQ